MIETTKEYLNNTYYFVRTWKPPTSLTISGIKYLKSDFEWKSKIFCLFFDANLTTSVINNMQMIDNDKIVIHFNSQEAKIFYKVSLSHYLHNKNLLNVHVT